MATRQATYCVARGLVQGVGFRAFVLGQARKLGVTGWVRNGADGRSVEVVAEGDADALRRLQVALRSGPPGARVDELDCNVNARIEGFDRFEIRR